MPNDQYAELPSNLVNTDNLTVNRPELTNSGLFYALASKNGPPDQPVTSAERSIGIIAHNASNRVRTHLRALHATSEHPCTI